MTYRKLYEKAERKLEKGEITSGEFDEMTKSLDEEIRPHGEWIPCSERLPEEHYTYFVTIKNASGSTFTTTSYFFTKEVGWSHDGVIAWMSFPKPYVERPHGEWEYDDRSGQFICSECEGGVDMPTLMGEPLYKWCPWCGADMREGEAREE